MKGRWNAIKLSTATYEHYAKIIAAQSDLYVDQIVPVEPEEGERDRGAKKGQQRKMRQKEWRQNRSLERNGQRLADQTVEQLCNHVAASLRKEQAAEGKE